MELPSLLRRTFLTEMIKAIIFDAFGTLFKVTGGASARTIISHIEKAGVAVDKSAFLKEWKAFYKEKTTNKQKCSFFGETIL